jgi:hypothetical protein
MKAKGTVQVTLWSKPARLTETSSIYMRAESSATLLTLTLLLTPVPVCVGRTLHTLPADMMAGVSSGAAALLGACLPVCSTPALVLTQRTIVTLGTVASPIHSMALPTILTEALHDAFIPPPAPWAPRLPALWPAVPGGTGAGVWGGALPKHTGRVTGGDTVRTRHFIARTTRCNIGDASDVLCLDPGHQVLDLVRAAWRDLEAELPHSLCDLDQVGGVDQGDAELLVIAHTAAMGDQHCQGKYKK